MTRKVVACYLQDEDRRCGGYRLVSQIRSGHEIVINPSLREDALSSCVISQKITRFDCAVQIFEVPFNFAYIRRIIPLAILVNRKKRGMGLGSHNMLGRHGELR